MTRNDDQDQCDWDKIANPSGYKLNPEWNNAQFEIKPPDYTQINIGPEPRKLE
jgi:hypothetical protein